MKIFEKQIVPTGRRVHIRLFGIKIASYNIKNNVDVRGVGNIVQVPDNSTIILHVYGNNNRIIIEDSIYFPIFSIQIGLPGEMEVNNCTVHIGKNLSAGGGVVWILEDNTTLEIGEDCMFSSEINMWASDTHTVLRDGKCSNVGKYIKLGDHIWLGQGATILKNTIIADNSIIGTRSVVSGTFNEKGSVIAGNPANVVRTGMNWDRRQPKKYIEQSGEKND